MRHQGRPSAALGLLLLSSALFAGACRDDSPLSGPTPPGGSLDSPSSPLGTLGRAEPHLAYARAIPGFGGLFLDPGTGVPTVYLTDLRQRSSAQTTLSGALSDLGFAPSRLQVLQGDYDFIQLDTWLGKAAPEALALPGSVFTDLDEASNRLRIGVLTAEAERSVRGVLARLGIPNTAVIVERTLPVHTLATLRQDVSPEQGGLQISNNGGLCTLGFTSVVPSTGSRGFITNSHCTTTRGQVEGSRFHQPLATNLIGTEAADPAFFTGPPCPSGRRCRWSDAARVRYAAGISNGLGQIARTTSRNALSGSITINAADPVLRITSEIASPLQFSQVNKIGRTTGWTFGVVTNTCVTTNVKNTTITMVCQDRVSGGSGNGDSGSPVFTWSGGSTVALNGILWGGSTASDFWFSRMSLIELELGSLRTF
jgi:hypothetical protein